MSGCLSSYYNSTLFPLFGAFPGLTPTIPSFYWDVDSQEQRIKELCELLHKCIAFAEATAEHSAEVGEKYDELLAEFEKFKESGFDDYYREQVAEWVQANLEYVFTQTAKQVYFGIDLDGYFNAYVPQSWDDIVFDTGFDPSKDTYGRLILRWEVAPGASPVDQEPEELRL